MIHDCCDGVNWYYNTCVTTNWFKLQKTIKLDNLYIRVIHPYDECLKYSKWWEGKIKFQHGSVDINNTSISMALIFIVVWAIEPYNIYIDRMIICNNSSISIDELFLNYDFDFEKYHELLIKLHRSKCLIHTNG